ncbi:MAG: hypothetical protein JKY65_31730 [Planctomycetes bacterium]|nr:hypothetical protein [Planctomycetota bacterium]
MILETRQKAAVLLLAVGPEAAGEALRSMRQDSVADLVRALQELGESAIPGSLVREVLREFRGDLERERGCVRASPASTQRVLSATLAPGPRRELVSRLEREERSLKLFAEFELLRPADLALALAPELTQVKALVLANVSTELAGQAIKHFDEEERVGVIMRIARMEEVPIELALQVGRVLGDRTRQASRNANPTAKGTTSPLRRAANVLGELDGSEEGRRLRQALRSADQALAEQIDEEAFALEDLVSLADSAVQRLLGRVEGKTLALALKGCDAAISEKLLGNLSRRARESVNEERELLGPQSLSAVKEAQSELLGALRELVQSGQVTIQRGSEAQLVQ